MKSGIYEASAAKYHADELTAQPALSSSIARRMLSQSPRHAWWNHPRLNPNFAPEESDTFDYGTAAHAMLLEGSQSGLMVVEADDWRTKAARELRDQARAEGKTPILTRQLNRVKTMVAVAKEFVAQSEIAGAFDAGKPEVTLVWTEGTAYCKARLDWLTDDRAIVLDYKTTTNAEPEAFIRQMVGMGYDFQAAFYMRGLFAVSEAAPEPYPYPAFSFLAQEVEAPFACSLVGLSEPLREIAALKVERAIMLWMDCMAKNEWPCYPTRICYAEPTTWQMKEHEAYLEAA